MRKQKRKLSGYTLVELMTAVFIFAMVVGIIFTTFFVGQRYWHVGFDYVWLGQQARLAIDRMSNELYLVRPGYSNNVIEDPYQPGNFEQGGRSIKFKVPVIYSYEISPGNIYYSYYHYTPLGPPEINWGAEGNVGWKIKYRVNDNHQLVREIWDPTIDTAFPVSSSILANNIDSVRFRGYNISGMTTKNYLFDNPTAVNIEVQSSKQPLFSEPLSYLLASDIVFRN